MNTTKAQLSAEVEALRKEKELLIQELASARKNLDIFQTLYQHLPLPTQSLDGDGVIRNVNKAWQDRFGYAASEVIGRPMADFVVPDPSGALHCRFKQFLKEGKVSGVTFNMRHTDGTVVPVSIEGGTSITAEGQRTHSVLFDLDEQGRTRQKYDELSQRYTALFEESPTVTLVIDPENGSIREANAVASRFYGYTPEEMTRLHVWDLKRDINRDRLLEDMKRVVQKGKDSFSSVHYTKTGEPRNVEAHVGRVLLGDKIRLYYVILDVTGKV
ncbi:MAG: PAS domain-containing protein, partial [Proteobacteria bacterium]|nr:PAS domain-containing protein [Pseudomonadota bacterium]